MDATVDRILMSRSGKDLHRGFSRPIFGDKKWAFLDLVSCLWADAHRGKNGGMQVFG
jgi:hypothetical protein